MTLSKKGAAFIESFEKFSAAEYESGGKWYIGYGTSCAEGQYPGGVTEAEAEKLLLAAAAGYEASVNGLASDGGLTFTQTQFDALVSFTYNLGDQWMSTSSRIYNYILKGVSNYPAAEIVSAFGTWCHVGGAVSESLAARREAEAKLFLYGDYGGGGSPDYCWLKLDAAGGSTEHDIVFFEKGKAYGALPPASRSGFTFIGWYGADGKLSASSAAEGDLSVSARWSGYSLSFPDVEPADWFYTYVSELAEDGVVNGYPDGSFVPADELTSGEALKLVLLAAGYGEQGASGGSWAGGYRDLAVSSGFLTKADIGELEGPMTRLLIAKLAARALGLASSSAASPFSDVSDGWVTALYAAGVVQGTERGGAAVYLPGESITRAEISAVVWRIKNSSAARDTYITVGSKKVKILKSVPKSVYSASDFTLKSGRMSWSGGSYELGVDVSTWQGDIDWKAVAADGIKFAIVRLGYRGYVDGSLYTDKYFLANVKGAKAAGLTVGVYFFSQAVNADEGKAEAAYVLSKIKGLGVTGPVVFDWESIGTASARTDGLGSSALNAAASAFCTAVSAAGYKPTVYFNTYLAYMKYDLSAIRSWPFWLAQYESAPDFYYDFSIWQYTDSGAVAGITGGVDMDIKLR